MKKKTITLLSLGLVNVIALAGLAILGAQSLRKGPFASTAADDNPACGMYVVGENAIASTTFAENWTPEGGYKMTVNPDVNKADYKEEHMLLGVELSVGDQFLVRDYSGNYKHNDDDGKYYGPAFDEGHITALDDNWVNGNMLVSKAGKYDVYFQITNADREQIHISPSDPAPDGYYLTGSFLDWSLDPAIMLPLVKDVGDGGIREDQYNIEGLELAKDDEIRVYNGFDNIWMTYTPQNAGKGLEVKGDNLVAIADITVSLYFKNAEENKNKVWVESDYLPETLFWMSAPTWVPDASAVVRIYLFHGTTGDTEWPGLVMTFDSKDTTKSYYFIDASLIPATATSAVFVRGTWNKTLDQKNITFANHATKTTAYNTAASQWVDYNA